MTAPEIITFGCRLNAFESEVIRQNVRAAGLGDTVVVNTCAVTAEAERQARQAIRRARRARPGARIIVTGCAAQLAPQRFAAMEEVDQVLGNAEKLELRNFTVDGAERVAVNDIFEVGETAPHLIAGFEGRARAFVQVQNGCDHRCTFCIIPFARGNSRSVAMGAVVRQVEALVGNGYREIVLTGVDITAYGADLPGAPALGTLCCKIFDLVPALRRLRLGSIDPVEVDDELTALITGEPRMMPHLHLSLQSGDDMVLKRMKRRHSRADAVAFCRTLRELRPEIVFGADLIAGFPTESEAMFESTLRLIADCGLVHLHVFPFSPRPGTPAAAMPQVRPDIRKRRAAKLRAAGDKALGRHLAGQVGNTDRILVERNRHGRAMGHGEQFVAVTLDRELAPGTVAGALITGVRDHGLEGTAQAMVGE